MKKTEARQSNLEALRIVSMLLIVMSHSDDIFGLYDLYSISLGYNKIITDWLHIGGQIGVGCFILISGYFMVEKNTSVKKLLILAGEVWCYTIGIWIVWVVYNVCQGQIILRECLIEAIYAFFPILFSHYWFVTAYIILMILSPFLNKFIFSLDKYNYQKFLGCLIVIFVVLLGGIPNILKNMSQGRLLGVFIMYFIAGYIRRFCCIELGDSGKHLKIAFFFYFLLFTICYGFTYLGIILNSKTILDNRYFYRALNSPIVVVICIELFMFFLKLNIKYNKGINRIAGCTFGVYLLHSNRLVDTYLANLFPIYQESNTYLVFIYSVVSVVMIYAVCSIIDYIRKKLIERIWIKIIDKHWMVVHNKMERVLKEISLKWNKRDHKWQV